jgi:hypothetical protein
MPIARPKPSQVEQLPVFTVVVKGDGSYLHVDKEKMSVLRKSLPRVFDVESMCKRWQHIVRDVNRKGQSCVVRMVIGFRDYDDKNSAITEDMTIRVLKKKPSGENNASSQ